MWAKHRLWDSLPVRVADNGPNKWEPYLQSQLHFNQSAPGESS